MRNKIVAGNWKMNTTLEEGVVLAKKLSEFASEYKSDENKKIIIAVPYTHIDRVVNNTNKKVISVAAQNCCMHESGAYTGEISAKMIKSLNCDYVIIGHSERRQYFGDTDAVISEKLEMCYKNNLNPILCCGEKKEEREEGNHFNVVKFQLINSLLKVDASKMKNTIVAYEPVWAIGTGLTASPEQAQEMHAFIRETIKHLYGNEIAQGTSILYGGSVNGSNASELFACDDIDGGLVGGASLKADDFITIIKAM